MAAVLVVQEDRQLDLLRFQVRRVAGGQPPLLVVVLVVPVQLQPQAIPHGWIFYQEPLAVLLLPPVEVVHRTPLLLVVLPVRVVGLVLDLVQLQEKQGGIHFHGNADTILWLICFLLLEVRVVELQATADRRLVGLLRLEGISEQEGRQGMTNPSDEKTE